MGKAPIPQNQGLSMKERWVDEHQAAKECVRKAVLAIPEKPDLGGI